MKKSLLFLCCLLVPLFVLKAGVVEKTYRFDRCTVNTTREYSTITLPGTVLSGIPGEPTLPYQQVTLVLPPGQRAVSVEFIGKNDSVLQGSYLLFPGQDIRETMDTLPRPFRKNASVYAQNGPYPGKPTGQLMTQYLNGVAFALCTFTPVKYEPALRRLSYYRTVTIRITTESDPAAAEVQKNRSASPPVIERLNRLAQNPEALGQYSSGPKSPATYQYLIIAPAAFQNEFQSLIECYSRKGIVVYIATAENISSTVSGYDLQEKIRNYIKSEYQLHSIQYVLLAGKSPALPHRGFYCHVVSGAGYTDSGIPSDLYFSGMDGTYDSNGNHVYAEVTDEPDLLPELSVGRMPAADTAELRHMIAKTVSYQTNPVPGEFNRPLLVGEYLYASPLTFGSTYMNLLVGNQSANGYSTYGIPASSNNIRKLYDSIVPGVAAVGYWTAASLIEKINSGHSFIHHLGHSSTSYMMRLYMADITDATFSQVNGMIHNFTILYTQGCYSGAFDQNNCIASKSLSIHNFLVAGIFNSRYGWFNEGTSDGPSEHLEREFVSALYDPATPEKHIGTTHLISKIKTVPFISLPGEFEPGAQRWVQYCSNVLGDPAMEIWTQNLSSYPVITWTGAIDTDWSKAGNWSPAVVPTTLNNVVIPLTANKPVVNLQTVAFCHDLTVKAGTSVTVNSGKTLNVKGNMTLEQ